MKTFWLAIGILGVIRLQEEKLGFVYIYRVNLEDYLNKINFTFRIYIYIAKPLSIFHRSLSPNMETEGSELRGKIIISICTCTERRSIEYHTFVSLSLFI